MKPVCPHCQSQNTVNNGRQKRTNTQKAQCLDCGKHFQARYIHQAYKAGTVRQINRLTDDGLSVRETAKRLKISPTTVWTKRKVLEQAYSERISQPYPIPAVDLHVISWSGGKDSSALLVWAREHLPQDQLRVIFCDTGWESPITYQFIEEVNNRLLDGRLIVLKSQKYTGFVDLAKQKRRFPSTKARFCTEELKIVPMIEWILSQHCDIAVYQGIRAGESVARSRMSESGEFFKPQIDYDQNPHWFVDGQWKRKRTPIFQKQAIAWLESYECSVERPLFYWKTKDILTLCRKHNVLSPLYEQGFDRVGCFPCIMASKREVRRIAELDPERIETIAKAEAGTGHSFFPYSKVPDSQCEKPAIHDVVKWAFSNAPTSEQNPPSCLSHYAQCE